MSIPFDSSPPLITPARALAEQCARQGVDPKALALPPILVGTFQGASYQHLVARTGAAPPPDRSDGTAVDTGISIGKTPSNDQPLAVARLPAGAPAAVLALEAAIARGVRCVLIVGSAGSLRPDLPIGSTVVVTGAVREEGTSYHYLPAGTDVTADPGDSELLERCARAAGLNPVRGLAWTTDAPYRETLAAVARHRSRGVRVVEMEASAIFAVSKVRGVRASLLVAVADELQGSWQPGFHDNAYLDSLTRGIGAALEAAGQLTAPEQEQFGCRTEIPDRNQQPGILRTAQQSQRSDARWPNTHSEIQPWPPLGCHCWRYL